MGKHLPGPLEPLLCGPALELVLLPTRPSKVSSLIEAPELLDGSVMLQNKPVKHCNVALTLNELNTCLKC